MSIALRPNRRQYVLKNAVIRELSRQKVYRNELVRLRADWKPVATRYWPGVPMPDLYHVLQLLDELEQEIGPVEPSLATYVRRLREATGDHFRLRHEGQPAKWALEAIHNHVTSGNDANRPVGLEMGEFLIWREAQIKVKVTDDGATITVTDHVGTPESHPIHGDGILSFQDWQRLEDAAIANLKEQIAEIRRHFEDEYQRLGTGRDQRRRLEDDLGAIPQLVEIHLATPRNRLKLDPAIAKRMQRIRQLIGIDAPDKTGR